MGDDNTYSKPVKFDEEVGLFVDRWGNYLADPDKGNREVKLTPEQEKLLAAMKTGLEVEEDERLPELCCVLSAYGFLMWCIGDENDFYCYDWDLRPTETGLWLFLETTVNSETGGFIDNVDKTHIGLHRFENWEAAVDECVMAAAGAEDEGLDFCAINEIELDSEGWGHAEEGDENWVSCGLAASVKEALQAKCWHQQWETYRKKMEGDQ